MNAVDTNVYVYALDDDEPVKQAKALHLFQRLVQGNTTVLLWQVATELLANLRRRESAGKITAGELDSRFRKFVAMFPVIIPSIRVISSASD